MTKDRFPDLQGFSPRNLNYMRTFASVYPDREFVQQPAAQIPWGQNVVLMDKTADSHGGLNCASGKAATMFHRMSFVAALRAV